MPTFEQGDVVRVPFPYTDGQTRQRRPALVVSSACPDGNDCFLWVVMVTSAAHRAWPGDVPFGEDLAGTGLPAPSVVRTAKIATIEVGRAAKLGRAAPSIIDGVLDQVGLVLGRSPGRLRRRPPGQAPTSRRKTRAQEP